MEKLLTGKFFPIIAGAPLLVLAVAFICCYSYIPSCKDEHKKEKQISLEQNFSIYISPSRDQKKATEITNNKNDAQITHDCGAFCGLVTKTVDDPVGLFTLILCLVVWLQFLWMTRQEVVLVKSVAAATLSASAAMIQAKAAVASQLPVIGFGGQKLVAYDQSWNPMEHMDPVPSGLFQHNMRALICLKNVGRTYANIFRYTIRWAVAKELPAEPYYGHMAIDNQILEPDQPLWFVYMKEPIVLNSAEIAEIQSGITNLWVYGFFAYGDFMEGKHTVGFSFRCDKTHGFVVDGPERYRYQTHPKQAEKPESP